MTVIYEDFKKIKIHIGTIISVTNNEKAKKPALVLKINFGEKIGIKTTSAQITDYYNKTSLIGKQVIAVCNFASKNIAGIISEVLILGAVEKNGTVVLLHPSQPVENGLEIF